MATIGDDVGDWAMSADAVPKLEPQITFPSTSCRSIRLRFGFDKNLADDVPGLTLGIVIKQIGIKAQTTFIVNQVRTLVINLGPGAWSISSYAEGPGFYNFYLDGVATCSTSDGMSG